MILRLDITNISCSKFRQIFSPRVFYLRIFRRKMSSKSPHRVYHKFSETNQLKNYSHRAINWFCVINGTREVWSNFGWYLDQQAINELSRNTTPNAKLILHSFSIYDTLPIALKIDLRGYEISRPLYRPYVTFI